MLIYAAIVGYDKSESVQEMSIQRWSWCPNCMVSHIGQTTILNTWYHLLKIEYV